MMDEATMAIIGLAMVIGNVFWHVYVGVLLGFTMLNIFFTSALESLRLQRSSGRMIDDGNITLKRKNYDD